MPSGPEWWARTWYCPFCKTIIKRHHRARHEKGKGHLARVKTTDTSYEWLASDTLFSLFLYGFDARTLSGYEKKMYDYWKGVGNNEVMQAATQGYI